MTISRWRRGEDTPDEMNSLLLQARLGISPMLWRVKAGAGEVDAPSSAWPMHAPEPAGVQAVRVPERDPAEPPWPPLDDGPKRQPGESFREAVQRREAWRVRWQSDWSASCVTPCRG
jgi:hypothetical protein